MWAEQSADLSQLEAMLSMFRLALTVIGAGLILIGIVMYFYRPKDESKRSKFSARVTALVSFSLIGSGTILYAWTWFGT